MAPHRWTAFAVVATISLAACSGGGQPKASAANGQVEGPAPAAPQVKGARTLAELSQALDITVPSGYARQPDSIDDTGPSDLDKAVADDGGDDARDVFTRDRFVRGYQREWARSADGASGGSGVSPGENIVSYVDQFADNAGAVDYAQRMTADAGVQTAGVTITAFTVPGIAGAVGVNSSDRSFASSTVTFVKGPYAVQVVVNGTKPDGLQAMVTSVAEEQYSRL